MFPPKLDKNNITNRSCPYLAPRFLGTLEKMFCFFKDPTCFSNHWCETMELPGRVKKEQIIYIIPEKCNILHLHKKRKVMWMMVLIFNDGLMIHITLKWSLINLYNGLNIWVFPKIGVSPNGWFIMENPLKMGWFGRFYPYFWKHPYKCL